MYSESDISRGVVRNVRFNMMGQIERKTYSPEPSSVDGPIDFSKRRRLDTPKLELESQPLIKLTAFSQQFLAERITPPLMHPPSPQNKHSDLALECKLQLRYSPHYLPHSNAPAPSPAPTSRQIPAPVEGASREPAAISWEKSAFVRTAPTPTFERQIPAPVEGVSREPAAVSWEKSALIHTAPAPKFESLLKRTSSKLSKSFIDGDMDLNAQFRNFTGSETEKKLREESRRRFDDFRREMIEKMECARRSRVKAGRSLSERRDSLCYSSDDQKPLEDGQHSDMNNKDNEYFYRRRKNNEAAKKSRDLRRTREEENEIKVQFYEMENENLRNQLSLVLHQLALYQGAPVENVGMARSIIPCVERN